MIAWRWWSATTSTWPGEAYPGTTITEQGLGDGRRSGSQHHPAQPGEPASAHHHQLGPHGLGAIQHGPGHVAVRAHLGL